MRKILAVVWVLLMAGVGNVRAADENLMAFVGAVEQSYIEPLPIADLAKAAFKGLQDMDPKVRIADDKTRFTFYYDAKVYRNFNKPEGENSREWVELIDRVFKAAVKISAPISLRDYEAPDAMMSRMVEALDKDSKFYRAMDMADNSALKARRNFASRRIGDILYVRVGVFDINTSKQMSELMAQEKGAKAMILDLRGNSGGQLEAAAQVAGLFLDGGMMFMTRGRGTEANMVYSAEAKGDFDGKPVAILTDGETASAAELMAGSLQEQNRALLLGTETFGKRTTQRLVSLPNGSVFGLTNAYVYLPSGESLAEGGVRPDYCLSGKKGTAEAIAAVAEPGKGGCARENRKLRDEDVEAAVELLKTRI